MPEPIPDLMAALEESIAAAKQSARRRALDNEMRAAGFHGYEGCPHGDCPTPYLCSERGDCPSGSRPDEEGTDPTPSSPSPGSAPNREDES